MGRILGLDYGEKRLGFAVSDQTGTIATPLRVVECRSRKEVLAAIEQLLAETASEKLVIGLPLNMNGTKGPAALNVLALIEELSIRVAVPVETWDERLSTTEATNVLIDAGASRQRRKQVVDKLAATIMLQSYLDAHSARDEASWSE